MDWNDPDSRKLLESVAFSALSGFGGALGYIYREIQNDKRPNAWRALVEASAAAFVGVPMFLLCDVMNFGIHWTAITVSVFGWLGAAATIHVLEKLVFKKLGVGEREPD